MSVTLFSELNCNGDRFNFTADTPRMPPGWDAHSLSCMVDQYSIPCYFFELPDFGGPPLKLTRGGGQNDLDRLPGQWRNKIRSIRFDGNPRLSGDTILAEFPKTNSLSSSSGVNLNYNRIMFTDGLMTGGDIYSIGYKDLVSGFEGSFSLENKPGGNAVQVNLAKDTSDESAIEWWNIGFGTDHVREHFLRDGSEIRP